MDELDLFDRLTESRSRSRHADEFLGKLKTASGAKELVQAATQFAKTHKPEIAAAVVGGALLAAQQYHSSRPSKKDGLSLDQRNFLSLTRSQEEGIQDLQKRGKEPGLMREMGLATTRASSGVADVLAKHPGKAALMAAPLGAALGPKVLKAFK